MGGPHRHFLVALACTAAVLGTSFVLSSSASAGGPNGSQADELAAYWTPERVASAQPRDLVVDQRGLGYVRGRDGSLTPHGHSVAPALVRVPDVAAASPTPRAKPMPGGDTTGPTVTNMVPISGEITETLIEFSATVADNSGVASVSVVVRLPSGTTQSFAATRTGNVWAASVNGFSNGSWSWWIVAKDGASRGGNTTTTPPIAFTVNIGGQGGGGGGDGVVTNAKWTGGVVQQAAGRILFEMPTVNGRRTTWTAYVCSGTVASDTNSNASIIITAAHCVYDDVAKQFARNVLFIPNQAETSATGTDWDCSNDPLGCWSPSYGVVDANWTTRTFPDNVEWDYAYYVVSPTSHTGTGTYGALDGAVSPLPIGFNAPVAAEDYTHAFGYSYSNDPNFMYCAESLGIQAPNVDWWLPNCGLTGGSSGGPWIEPLDSTGSGPIISLNSWGYTNQPGMAGPVLDASALCTFNTAVASDGPSGTTRGLVASC